MDGCCGSERRGGCLDDEAVDGYCGSEQRGGCSDEEAVDGCCGNEWRGAELRQWTVLRRFYAFLSFPVFGMSVLTWCQLHAGTFDASHYTNYLAIGPVRWLKVIHKPSREPKHGHLKFEREKNSIILPYPI